MAGEEGDTRKDDRSRENCGVGEENQEKIVVRDKIQRTPPVKQDKRVSTSSKNSRERKSSYDGKPKQHVSRTVDKLKTAANRRSSSTHSQKRRRSQSPEDPPIDKSVSDKSMDDENPDLKCPDCDVGFDKDDSCLCCECCARWFHAKCHNISEEQVTAFKLLKELAHYYCPNCKAGASELHKAAVDIRVRVESIEKQVESLNRDNETNKTDIKSLQSQQKTNTSNLKTLKTVHEKLKIDVETANTEMKTVKTDIKTLKTNDNQRKEDLEKVVTNQNCNTIKLNTVSTRLDTIAEDIVKKINTVIDDRIDAKAPLTPTTVSTAILEDDKVKNEIIKLIDERLAVSAPDNDNPVPMPAGLANEQLKQVITKEVKEKVEQFRNEHFPYIPSHEMEVDEASNANTAPKVNPTFSSAVLNVMTEREEIRKRKNQVVITNLRENQNPDDDVKETNEIFTLMGVNVPLVEAIRVGRKKPSRPRVIRVTLQNPTDKRTLLAKATTLRNIPDDHKFAKVYVKPNLTQNQQIESKNLHRQLKEIRLKNPQITYKISQGKVIEVPQTTETNQNN